MSEVAVIQLRRHTGRRLGLGIFNVVKLIGIVCDIAACRNVAHDIAASDVMCVTFVTSADVTKVF